MIAPEALPVLELSAVDVERARRSHVLRSLVQLRLDADRLVKLRDAIDFDAVTLRAAGASWQTIGFALNITRQAAQQRYGSVPND